MDDDCGCESCMNDLPLDENGFCPECGIWYFDSEGDD